MKNKIPAFIFTVIMLCNTFLVNVHAEGNKYYDQNGNYYNPITHESLIWCNSSENSPTGLKKIARKVKTFKFTIRYSVTSSPFKLKNTNAKIKINDCYYSNALGNHRSGKSGHLYHVNLHKTASISSNIARFTCPSSNVEKSLGGGFSKDHDYLITITNEDGLSAGQYITGNGEVITW